MTIAIAPTPRLFFEPPTGVPVRGEIADLRSFRPADGSRHITEQARQATLRAKAKNGMMGYSDGFTRLDIRRGDGVEQVSSNRHLER